MYLGCLLLSIINVCGLFFEKCSCFHIFQQAFDNDRVLPLATKLETVDLGLPCLLNVGLPRLNKVL